MGLSGMGMSGYGGYGMGGYGGYGGMGAPVPARAGCPAAADRL